MATEHAEAAAGSATGMPQLEISTFPNQIFWLVVTLVVIYLILSRVALPRIASVLAERLGTITNDLTAAEDLKLKAVEAEKAYEQALADARSEANRIVEAARTDIKADLEDAIAKADAEIAAKTAESEAAIAEIRAHAVESVTEVARTTAVEIANAIAPAPVDAKTVIAAVDSRLKG